MRGNILRCFTENRDGDSKVSKGNIIYRWRGEKRKLKKEMRNIIESNMRWGGVVNMIWEIE